MCVRATHRNDTCALSVTVRQCVFDMRVCEICTSGHGLSEP